MAEAEATARAGEETKRRRLTLALASTVLLAMTLGGSGWLWVKADRDGRMALLTRDVNEALNRAIAFREQAKLAPTGSVALFIQAREQAQRALALVENGPADGALAAQVRRLQAELDDEEKDRMLVTALDEARLAQAETVAGESRFALERAVPEFRRAFNAYGLPAGAGEPGAAAERIRQRPAAVREAILAALDEWDDLAGNPKNLITEPHREWLRALLAAAEPEDSWSRQVRAARAEKNDAKRRSALEKLAASANVGQVPARALTLLARRLDPAPRLALLRRAQAQSPADFWLNHDLGMAMKTATSPERDGAVRFLTAAVALRPDSPGCVLNLGNALKGKGQVDEAIACYKRAIELDPKYAMAFNNLGIVLRDKDQVDEAIACFQKAIELDPNYANAHHSLGSALKGKGQVDEAIACYKRAIELNPKYAIAFNNLGIVLKDKVQVDEAIACIRRAIELDPKLANARNSLGTALKDKGRVDEAIASYKKAIELDPKYAMPHNNLGNALKDKGQVDEAIASYKKAIELDPKLALADNNLGNALKDKGQVDEAIASYKKAIELEPKYAGAHNNLGGALKDKGQVDEAIACFKKAIELDPKLAMAHYNAGLALADKGQADEAIVCYKRAIELAAKFASAHNNLGLALKDKGQLDEAIVCYKRAIELEPKYAGAHNNLGNALKDKGQVDEAIASYKKAIELEPKNAVAHTNLGIALKDKGQVDEAIACFRRAVEQDPKFAGARSNLARAERLAAARDKLPAFQKGAYTPASKAERLDLAEWCQIKKLHHTATGLFAAAFATDPKLADDLKSARRYNAACNAARAAAGQGEDAPKLDDKERARLRQQALDWLKADLALRAKQLETGKPADRAAVQPALRHWQQDPDLIAIRDAAALTKLPPEEQKACTQLWADVAALLKKAETKKEIKP